MTTVVAFPNRMNDLSNVLMQALCLCLRRNIGLLTDVMSFMFTSFQLQDLPIELLTLILVKAVVVEVKSTKLVKSVWKEKADLVTSRLETVCSLWSNIVTTDYFRKEVHEILDGTGQFIDQIICIDFFYQPNGFGVNLIPR